MRSKLRKSIVFLIALVPLLGCLFSGDGVSVDEIIPAWVETLAMPDTLAGAGSIDVRITGYWGTSSAYRRERIEQEKIVDTWTIRPMARHREEEGHGYLTALAEFDETITLPADSGWTWVLVLSQKPPLLDSVLVLP